VNLEAGIKPIHDLTSQLKLVYASVYWKTLPKFLNPINVDVDNTMVGIQKILDILETGNKFEAKIRKGLEISNA